MRDYFGCYETTLNWILGDPEVRLSGKNKPKFSVSNKREKSELDA